MIVVRYQQLRIWADSNIGGKNMELTLLITFLMNYMMIAVNQLESNVRMSLFVIRDAVNSFSATVKPQNKRQTHTSSTTMPHQLSTVMHEERDSIFINRVISNTRLPSLPLSFSSLLFNITFLASCLRPAGVRVKQTLFGVSRTEWLVLAWKPVFFPQATKSLRNRWDARNYLFLWFYSRLKDSKSATRITTTVFYTLTVSFFRVPMSDQRSNVDVLIFQFFFKPYFVFCCFFLYWNLSAHLEDIKLTERQVKSKLFCWGKKCAD